MPATSKAQRRFMAMCEHHPGSVQGKCPNMSKSQFHDFAVTKEKNLPYKAKKKHRRSGAVRGLMGN